MRYGQMKVRNMCSVGVTYLSCFINQIDEENHSHLQCITKEKSGSKEKEWKQKKRSEKKRIKKRKKE
jgi:hypothetical protein